MRYFRIFGALARHPAASAQQATRRVTAIALTALLAGCASAPQEYACFGWSANAFAAVHDSFGDWGVAGHDGDIVLAEKYGDGGAVRAGILVRDNTFTVDLAKQERRRLSDTWPLSSASELAAHAPGLHAAFTEACATEPVAMHGIVIKLLSHGGRPTLAEVEELILAGVRWAGWEAKPVPGENTVQATRSTNKVTLTAEITYTRLIAEAFLVGSTAGFDQGMVPPKFNDLVASLLARINLTLDGGSTAHEPE